LVKVLKYEPFPVNAGDYFDLWVKVQNIGQNDALNAKFTLAPEYPFSSNDSLTREYGLIAGAINAYKVNQDSDASQVILKYRLKVADDAKEGISNVKLMMNTNSNDASIASETVDLPIEIAKTKTTFDVSVHDMSSQETSFVVTNVGDEDAKTVSIRIADQNDVTLLSGAEPALLGDLNKGDFTIAHIKAVPKKGVNALTLDVSYTDSSGVRSLFEKKVSVSGTLLDSVYVQDTSGDYQKWVYGIVGLITGIFLVLIIILIRQKRKAAK